MSSQKTYVKKLERADDLRRKGATLLWERVKLLVEVFDDDDWRQHVGLVYEKDLAAVLDEKVDDTGFDFLQVYYLFKHFPEKEQWATGNLLIMFDDMRAELAGEDPHKPKRTVHRVTNAQYEDAMREIEALKKQLATLRGQLTRARARISELEEASERETVAA